MVRLPTPRFNVPPSRFPDLRRPGILVRLITTLVQERIEDAAKFDIGVVVVLDMSCVPCPLCRSTKEESTEEAASAQLTYAAEFGSCDVC
jgi:hypothetical protein